MSEKVHIVTHKHIIDAESRRHQNRHNSFVLWFTGLSGSGKSSISDKVEQLLFERGIHTYILDGDNVRKGLNKGLGFTESDRYENLRRVAEVAQLFIDAGIVLLCAFVSPLEKDRNLVKEIIGHNNFIEIFINTALEECERRDKKGLYKKARAGEIKNFTGIDSPYEEPQYPDIEIKTGEIGVEEAAKFIVERVEKKLNIQI